MKSEAEWDGLLLRELSPEWGERVIFIEECGSTNDEAQRLGKDGLRGESLVLAERQTGGRGRRGQPWMSPVGESVACSFLVRSEEPFALWSRLSLAAGLAVAEALDGFGVSAGVKWPNDVWVGGRKICGILLESEGTFAVVGIGLNVNTRDFPEGLAHPATSIALETGEEVRREEVLVAMLERLRLRTRQIGADFSELLEAWNERCVLRGKRIRLESSDGIKTGVMRGVTPGGELLLEGEDGVEKFLQVESVRLV